MIATTAFESSNMSRKTRGIHLRIWSKQCCSINASKQKNEQQKEDLMRIERIAWRVMANDDAKKRRRKPTQNAEQEMQQKIKKTAQQSKHEAASSPNASITIRMPLSHSMFTCLAFFQTITQVSHSSMLSRAFLSVKGRLKSWPRSRRYHDHRSIPSINVNSDPAFLNYSILASTIVQIMQAHQRSSAFYRCSLITTSVASMMCIAVTWLKMSVMTIGRTIVT